LNFSFSYHPQTSGQTERTNQILEDMLRSCALQYGTSWDKSFPYTKFSYNNIHQKSLKMPPFKVLYGRKCRTPLFWNQMGENSRKTAASHVFMSQLKKCLCIPEEQISLKELVVKEVLV
jgi:hypothetical protein